MYLFMPHIEPKYLRYIFDGLLKGSIHPENAAELREGLIGLYEGAFGIKRYCVKKSKSRRVEISITDYK